MNDAGETVRNTFTDSSADTVLQAGTVGTVVIRSPSDGDAPSDEVVPRQLPPDIPHFVNRDAVLRTLTALLGGEARRTGPLVITAGGTGGIGKTALAVHWGHQVAERFTGGQFYVNLRGFDPDGAPMDRGEAVRTLLGGLRVPPERVPTAFDAQVALYRSLTADRRLLVVLDNARDAEQVRPLLPAGPGCAVVVTSRTQLVGLTVQEGARPVGLDMLSEADAADLLTHYVGSERVAAERDTVTELAHACGWLPLALSVVGARAALRPGEGLAALADELREERDRLDALETPEIGTDLRAVFSWSYRALGEPAARLFRLAGTHPGVWLSPHAAASLLGESVVRTRKLLAVLVDHHLLVERAGGYEFHDLLRLYAAELADEHDPADERHAALRRLLDHYLHSAHAADLWLSPYADDLAPGDPVAGAVVTAPADHHTALRWFDAEHANLKASVTLAEQQGLDEHCWRVARTLGQFFDNRGHWEDWRDAAQASLGAGQRLDDPAVRGYARYGLCLANALLGHLDAALEHGGQAVREGAAADNPGCRAHAHHALRFAHAQLGEYAAAREHSERAAELFRDAEDVGGTAAAFGSVAWCRARLGEFRAAADAAREALKIARDRDLAVLEGLQHDILGYVHRQLGELDTAVHHYQRYVELYRELGYSFYAAQALVELGDTQCDRGEPATARDAWQRALTVLDEHEHPDAASIRQRLIEAGNSEVEHIESDSGEAGAAESG